MRQEIDASFSSNVQKMNRSVLAVIHILSVILVSLIVTTLIIVVTIDKRNEILQSGPFRDRHRACFSTLSCPGTVSDLYHCCVGGELI
jgi:hypothetical protein